MRALLFAWMLSALAPSSEEPRDGTLEIGHGHGQVVGVEYEDGRRLATITMAHDRIATLRLRPGSYVVVDEHGERRTVEVVEGETVRITDTHDLPATPPPWKPASVQDGANDEAPPRPTPRSPDAPPAKTTTPEAPPGPAWRAPLIAAFVPGMGHAYAGRPLLGVGLLTATTGTTLGAIALASELRAAQPSYARLGGFAALSSAAGLLYLSQIASAHRVERGDDWQPHRERVSLDISRMSAVSMAPGSRRAALYDDFSINAMVRLAPRVRAGLSDASLKLGPSQTVLQGGVRALYQIYGPHPGVPQRRIELSAGAGALVQVANRQRVEDPLDPAEDPSTRHETVASGTPYVLVLGELFVTRRITAGVLGRYALPLAPRYYAGTRALPRWASTFEFGVSMGVRL